MRNKKLDSINFYKDLMKLIEKYTDSFNPGGSSEMTPPELVGVLELAKSASVKNLKLFDGGE